MNCIVCYDSFNKTGRKMIQCNYCETPICRSCTESYIEQGETVDVICVNTDCKKVWSEDFIQSNMTKTFYKSKYKVKKQSILFNIERTYIPATQIAVENDLRVTKIKKQIALKRNKIYDLQNEISILNDQIGTVCVEKEQKTFIMTHKCPGDRCNGFLSDKWHCGLCETDVCRKCREIVDLESDEKHVCNEDIVKSVDMLKKDAKPCPKCMTSIHKIDGCDQMFCTQCHTAFSWKTLKIENGLIHNPHYFEWMRKTTGGVPRNPLDNPVANNACNPDPNRGRGRRVEAVTRTKIDIDTTIASPEFNEFLEICRLMNHIEFVDLVTNYRQETLDFNSNLKMRKLYLTGNMSEEEFRKRLYKKEKETKKKTEIAQILEVFVHAIRDLATKLNENKKVDLKLLKEFIKNAKDVREFVNNNLENISLRYENKVHLIKDAWKEW